MTLARVNVLQNLRAVFLLGIAQLCVFCVVEADQGEKMIIPELMQAQAPTITQEVPATAQKVDGIAAVVYTLGGVDPITHFEVARPGLDGRYRTLDDLIREKVMYRDAQKYHMVPSDDEVDKTIKAVQRDNNLNKEQLEQIFIAGGCTYEEGLEQFRVLTAVNNIMSFKIGANLIVSERDINAYYEANPIMQQASYTFIRAFIPLGSIGSSDEQLVTIRAQLAAAVEPLAITWDDPFSISPDDLAEEKRFILELLPGQISEVVQVRGGFECFKLIAHTPARLLTLDERRKEIADTLRRPRQQQLMDEYLADLKKYSVIEMFVPHESSEITEAQTE